MKLLMIYAHQFAFNAAEKNLKAFDDSDAHDSIEDVIVAFIQGEAQDVERAKNVKTKLIKNIKWLAGKLDTRQVVLHSFAHLSESKAEPQFVKDLFDDVEKRLVKTGYSVTQTPFGYFLDLDMQAPGFSLARVFKEI